MNNSSPKRGFDSRPSHWEQNHTSWEHMLLKRDCCGLPRTFNRLSRRQHRDSESTSSSPSFSSLAHIGLALHFRWYARWMQYRINRGITAPIHLDHQRDAEHLQAANSRE